MESLAPRDQSQEDVSLLLQLCGPVAYNGKASHLLQEPD